MATFLGVSSRGWRFRSAGATTCSASHPTLHGVRADGRRFSLTLALDSARREQQTLTLPGIDAPVDAIVLSGSVAVPSGPSLDWQLVLVMQSAGALLQLRVSVANDSGGTEGCRLQHITLGSFAPEQAAAATPSVASAQPAAAAPPALLRSVSSSAVVAGAASVAAFCTLTPVAAAAASAIAAAAPMVAYLRGGGPRGAAVASFLINGWQSFSFCGALRSDEAQPVTSLPFFSGAFHTGAAPPPATDPKEAAPALVSDLFALVTWHGGGGKKKDAAAGGARGSSLGARGGMLLGFVSAQRGVGGVASSGPDASAATLFLESPARLTAGSTPVETDWAMVLPIAPAAAAMDGAGAGAGGGTVEPAASAVHAYAEYMEALSTHAMVPAERAGRGTISAGVTTDGGAARHTPVGWCSWYWCARARSLPLVALSLRAPSLPPSLALALARAPASAARVCACDARACTPAPQPRPAGE